MMRRFVIALLVGCVASAAFAAKPAPAPRAASSDSAAALERSSARPSVSQGAGTYSADFENPPFTIGDINGQDGWFAQYGNWTIENTNPALGAQHLRGLSDALGQSFGLTTDQPPGTQAFSIAVADIFISSSTPAATWEFIPQDPTEGTGFVNTRVRFTPAGDITALDTSNAFVDTGANWTGGSYFTLSVTVERATNAIEICVNGTSIFTSTGFAPDIENVAVLGAMEAGTAGHTYDLDNLQIIDSATGGCFSNGPNIGFSSYSSTDACAAGAGGGNGVWEPGETITIPVTIVGNQAFTNVTGTLTSATPGVTIVDGAATWPNLPPGVPTQSDAPHFTVQLDEAFTCFDSISFSLAVNATEGGPFNLGLVRQVGLPATPAGLPLAIPDNSPAGASSTLSIADNLTITDANVHVQIDHTWVGDLIITLDPPGAAPPITLLDRPGVPTMSTVGCGDDNMDVTFDDAAAVDPENVCNGSTPWLSGLVLPVQALSALNGLSTQGDWVLTVSDNAGLDTGSVIDWGIDFTPTPSAGQCEVCLGGTSDLSLVKTVSPPVVAVGGLATFQMVVSNAGPDADSNVVVTDTLPAGLTYVSNDCGASFAAPTVTWNVGALASAANAICNVTVTVAAGAWSNNASATGANTDPTPANNVSVATVTGGTQPSVLEIPTLDKRALLLLAFALAAAAFVAIRRR